MKGIIFFFLKENRRENGDDDDDDDDLNEGPLVASPSHHIMAARQALSRAPTRLLASSYRSFSSSSLVGSHLVLTSCSISSSIIKPANFEGRETRRASGGASSSSSSSSSSVFSLQSYSSSSSQNLLLQQQKKSKLISFPLAQTGEGIAECEIIKWFIKVGDKVEQFEPICEVQSDKANIEITSRHSGTVKTICFEPGDIAEVGATLIEMEVVQEEEEEEEGEGESGEIGAPEETEDSSASKAEVSSPEKVSGTHVLASPAVRRVAREMGINLADVKGTGPQGRIVKEDVTNHSKPAEAEEGEAAHRETAAAEDTVLPLKGYTRAMFYSMQKTLEVPHFGFHEELNAEHLMQLKKVCKLEFERKLAHDSSLNKTQDKHSHPVLVDYSKAKLTMMPFLFKALSLALDDYPILNSSVDEEGKRVIQHGRHNIGCAMNTPFGLVVPNVKDVARKSVMDIALELHRLQVLAQSNHLSPDDINSGTITVSNIGTVAGTYASPLIHVPEVAIVALGRAQYLPRYDPNDESSGVKRTPIMPLSWSADHRVVDGATLASFCKVWKSYLESPDKMILHLC